jgi:uncharacterized protein
MDVLISSLPLLLPLCLCLGLASGFMAGLLGVGGGIILVPGLYYIFRVLGYDPDVIMHMAVATSLAMIIPTGIASARAHAKKNAVRFDLVKRIGPGLVVGVVFGIWLASHLETDGLILFFAVMLVVVSVLMVLAPTIPAHHQDGHGPKILLSAIGGFTTGVISSLMGIGGATLNVPFMSFHGIKIHQAVATAAALGPLIAIPGTLGFIVIGFGVDDLPPYTLGYLFLPALAVIAPISVLIVPYGARAAHSLPVKTLKNGFAAFIILVAAHMLYEALHVH